MTTELEKRRNRNNKLLWGLFILVMLFVIGIVIFIASVIVDPKFIGGLFVLSSILIGYWLLASFKDKLLDRLDNTFPSLAEILRGQSDSYLRFIIKPIAFIIWIFFIYLSILFTWTGALAVVDILFPSWEIDVTGAKKFLMK